ncbi:cell wall-binding repeat-containing protein [Bacillus carboniphilus]|uniref:Cell wall-binding repeat-containing protein n=1 Tax=Bacillus carboniphilus TaxID=86663 RepID=A0ABY9JTH5_9BACI|nr:cell wall-binding repeat-containing protein [Bacillus carboniphilus]WLR41730.1 cell wall-binding repeat-containing protein [Bacillus carboniphilus]
MRMLKKLFLLSILVVLGLAIVPTEKAEAEESGSCADGSSWGFSNYDFCLKSYSSGDDVFASITTTSSIERHWEMSLQRKVNGSWTTISTRTGYVSKSSPSNETFTNVERSNSPLKIYVKFYNDSSFSDYYGAAQSPYLYHKSNSNSLSYTGTVNDTTVLKYSFEIDEQGVLNVSSISNSEEISYTILNSKNESFDHDDTLVAGKYELYVTGLSAEFKEYNISLSGVNFSRYSTTLPSLNITNPQNNYVRLSKNTDQINIKGSSNGDITSISTPWLSQEFNVGTSFVKNVSLGLGMNDLSISTELNNGNARTEVKKVVSPTSKRITGSDRIETSTLISKEISKWGIQTDTVVLANSLGFPDGVSAVTLAANNNAPILLSNPDTLTSELKNEISRINPSKVLIIGGTDVISSNIENELKGLGVTNIQRIGGSNRYVTNTNIANEVVKETTTQAFIVRGDDFPDAIAIASYAAMFGQPVLLTTNDQLSNEVTSFLDENESISSFLIVGGINAVSESVEDQLSQEGTVHRISGVDRYDTSHNVVKFFQINSSSAIISDGTNFPDAISGSVFGALNRYHFILSDPNTLNSSTQSALDYLSWKNPSADSLDGLYILGGISNSVQSKIDSTYIK